MPQVLTEANMELATKLQLLEEVANTVQCGRYYATMDAWKGIRVTGFAE